MSAGYPTKVFTLRLSGKQIGRLAQYLQYALDEGLVPHRWESDILDLGEAIKEQLDRQLSN